MITRRRILAAGALVPVATLAAPHLIGKANAQAVTLKLQGFLPSAAAPQQAFEKFAADVTQKAGGRLVVQALPGGAVIAVTETLNAIQAGILDGHYSAASYFAARDPGFVVLGDTAAAYDNVDQRDRWWSEGGGEDAARALYARFGMAFVAPVFWPSEHIPARVAIAGIADMPKMKVRVPPGLIAEIVAKTGAAVVNLPNGEVFNALQSGVIDATDWASPALNEQVGLYKAAKFSIDASHSMPTTDISVNLAKWNALAADLKALVVAEARAMSAALKVQLAKADADAITKMRADGVSVITWSKADVAKLRQLTGEVQDAQAARSPSAKAIVDSHRTFQRRIGV
jgi:TRAP-type mannitol/chloroaromatic compound transport system substrate-binding protein